MPIETRSVAPRNCVVRWALNRPIILQISLVCTGVFAEGGGDCFIRSDRIIRECTAFKTITLRLRSKYEC